MYSARPPRCDPGTHPDIARMAALIKGMTDEQAMRDRIVDAFGYRRGMGWMATEAIAIERGRAKLFAEEIEHEPV